MKPKIEPISELHKRLRQYREEAKESEKEEIDAFTLAVATNRYSQKCLICFKAGLRFCKFWLSGFNCQDHDRERQLEAFTRKIEVLL